MITLQDIKDIVKGQSGDIEDVLFIIGKHFDISTNEVEQLRPLVIDMLRDEQLFILGKDAISSLLKDPIQDIHPLLSDSSSDSSEELI